MNSWFSMHGYAIYVWPSYGIVALVLGFYAVYTNSYRNRVYASLKKASSIKS